MFEQLYEERHQGQNHDRELGTDRPIACKILGEPKTFGEELYVVVLQFGENERRGPCKWWPYPGESGPEKPKGGEDAIVQFDSNGIPWITQWWPF